jgi:RNA polymerase sigma-70 factor (ECF subfamily)
MTTDTPQDRFETLLESHRGAVFKVANAYCRNAEDRRDLVQEICAQLWRAFPKYDGVRPFSTWMYRIALNVAISAARRAKQRQSRSLSTAGEVAEPSDDPTARRDRDERVDALLNFIGRLGDLDRALMLLYLEERSYREIAEVLGLSESNVATKIGRLKGQIRRGLSREDPHTLGD